MKKYEFKYEPIKQERKPFYMVEVEKSKTKLKSITLREGIICLIVSVILAALAIVILLTK